MCGAGGRAVKADPSFRRSSMDRAPQNTLGTAPVGKNTDEARYAGRQAHRLCFNIDSVLRHLCFQ